MIVPLAMVLLLMYELQNRRLELCFILLGPVSDAHCEIINKITNFLSVWRSHDTFTLFIENTFKPLLDTFDS